jgi:hypothetical protein
MQIIHYIDIFNRGCRLGGNIINYICQIIYSVHNNYYIKYDKNLIRFSDSIFIELLFNYIDIYNKVYISKFNKDEFYVDSREIHFVKVDIDTADFPYMMSKITQLVKYDIISYFKKNILQHLTNGLDVLASAKKYSLPYDPEKTLVIHLRLEDVRNVKDYDGSICSSYYSDKINNGETCYYINNYEKTINQQAPLSYDKLNTQINLVLRKNPGLDIVIITNPGETINLPYKVIYNDDPSFDLYLLSKSKYFIMSRSTFAISALFFGSHDAVYMPLWGHVVCCGVYTKYDNCKYNYFF